MPTCVRCGRDLPSFSVGERKPSMPRLSGEYDHGRLAE